MKLSINDLRVDSYATQVSELELTEVKGGTSPVCVYLGITAAEALAAAAVVAAAAITAYASSPSDSKTKTVTYDANGKVKDSTVTHTTHH